MFNLRLLLWFLLLDTWTWPEGSYERGSVLPSVRPPYSLSVLLSGRKFSQNWLFFFLKLSMVLGSPYLVTCNSRIFLKKVMSKMVKKGQKTRFFGLFKKIKSLVLSGIIVKRKFLWPFNILQKLHTWKKSGSQVIMAKNGSQPMRFQYFLIVNISLIDWHLTLIFVM